MRGRLRRGLLITGLSLFVGGIGHDIMFVSCGADTE